MNVKESKEKQTHSSGESRKHKNDSRKNIKIYLYLQ